MVPLAPTAANWLPLQVTLQRMLVVPELRAVQVAPSGEVRIAPLPPTATN